MGCLPAMLNKEWFQDRKSAFDESFHGGIHREMVQRCGIDRYVGVQPFGEQFIGHIVLVDTRPRGFGPACITSDAILDDPLTEVNRLGLVDRDLSSVISPIISSAFLL